MRQQEQGKKVQLKLDRVQEIRNHILLDYQKDMVNFMDKRAGVLHYADMGLGKTLTTLTSVFSKQALPCLIVCPKFALSVWEAELRKWFDAPSVIYTGTPKQREKLWKEYHTTGTKFLITNYEMVEEVAFRSGYDVNAKSRYRALLTKEKYQWKGLICDEIHSGGLFNYKTIKFKSISRLARNIPARYLLSGTPYRQGCIDFYGPLHIADPVTFDSYWPFVTKYCVRTKTPFGIQIERNPANIPAFRQMVRQYMIRMTKEEVLHQIPGKIRQTLWVEMSKEQQKVYDELTAELMTFIDDTGELLMTPSQLTLAMRQRQILACPQVLGLSKRGAAIDTIIEHSHLSLDVDAPVVVFTPFRKAIPHLEEAFIEEYGNNLEIYKITGGLTANEFGNQWKSFQNSKRKRVLLCVIKSGASFQATAASTAYFLGAEYDFNLNVQAEDRLNRLGQTKLVNIYYVMHKNTVDEAVAAKLNEKNTAANWVIGTQAEYLQMLKRLKYHG